MAKTQKSQKTTSLAKDSQRTRQGRYRLAQENMPIDNLLELKQPDTGL